MNKAVFFLVCGILFLTCGCNEQSGDSLGNVRNAQLQAYSDWNQANGMTLREYNRQQRNQGYGGNFTDEELQQQQLDRIERKLTYGY